MSDVDPFDALEHRMLAAHPDSAIVWFGGVPARSDHALNGAVVMRIEAPGPHWLIVSQGFTELWDKRSPNPHVSGLGFELSCRIPARGHDAGREVGWVLHWMQAVADVLASEGATLDHGHWMAMAEPQTEDEVCALAFVQDPALVETRSRNGRSVFLEMVGLRAGELDVVRASSVDGYVGCLRAHAPVMWIDPAAPSPLRDPAFRAAVETMARTQPSATGVVTGAPFSWRFDGDVLVLEVDDETVQDLLHALAHRLAYGQAVVFQGSNEVLALLPEEGDATREVRDGMRGSVLRVGERVAAVTDALQRRQGTVEGMNLRIEWGGRGSLW